MNKQWLAAAVAAALLSGCANVPRGAIPVVDAGTPLSAGQVAGGGGQSAPARTAQAVQQDSGVVVMVPKSASAPALITAPISTSTSNDLTFNTPPQGGVGSSFNLPSVPATQSPSKGALAIDEQLDGPVLALLTTAQQLQGGGDLNGAASSLERAQRIAPREPQVLYRLAEVRLAQGDAPQAEQFARRGLTYASGRPTLQAGLWELIAQARERQGDAAGASDARQRARVSL